MALIKEPYGLVYNTDGTLCTTYRDDDIPFRGVRSFAIEKATTNLSPQTVVGYQEISLVYKGEENGWKKYGISGTWNSGTYPYCAAIRSVSFTGGEYYSTSAFFKTNCQEKFATYFSSINYTNQPTISGGTTIRRIASDGSIYLARNGFAYVDSTSQLGYIVLRPKQNGETFNPDQHFLYVKNIQIEHLPYATSYVDGNRPAGRLRVGIDDLRDGRLYNHVLAFWFKVPPISTYELGNWPGRVGIVGNRVVPDYNEYSDYGIFIESNGNLNFGAMYNPEGSRTLSFPQIPKEEYENRWNNVVIVFDEDDNLVRHYKIYFNGEYHGYADVTRMDNYYYHAKPDTFYFYGINLRSHLLSNIFIGEYRRDDGTVIWTDDYIREVYEAQIPFPVSNKLAIY